MAAVASKLGIMKASGRILKITSLMCGSVFTYDRGNGMITFFITM